MKDAVDNTEGTCTGLSPHLLRGLSLLQEKWMLLIIDRLLHGPAGFNEIMRRADGICTTTLSQRLIVLEHAGLVVKTIHSTMPPRTSYALTESGEAVRPVLHAIEAWSRAYLPEPPEGGCCGGAEDLGRS